MGNQDPLAVLFIEVALFPGNLFAHIFSLTVGNEKKRRIADFDQVNGIVDRDIFRCDHTGAQCRIMITRNNRHLHILVVAAESFEVFEILDILVKQVSGDDKHTDAIRLDLLKYIAQRVQPLGVFSPWAKMDIRGNRYFHPIETPPISLRDCCRSVISSTLRPRGNLQRPRPFPNFSAESFSPDPEEKSRSPRIYRPREKVNRPQDLPTWASCLQSSLP